MTAVVIIPARLASTRLPNKLLLDETGKPLILHTIEAASQLFNVVVATQDQEIYDVVKDHARVIMTGDCKSGTERVRASLSDDFVAENDIVINWQADEPELDSQHVLALAVMMADDPEIDVATLAAPATKEEYLSPDVVKTVLDHKYFAMYFSRCSIPFGDPTNALKHIGIYAFRRKSLTNWILRGTTYPSESLEQLQWLQEGLKIKVCVRPVAYAGIDTRQEYDAFVKRNVQIPSL